MALPISQNPQRPHLNLAKMIASFSEPKPLQSSQRACIDLRDVRVHIIALEVREGNVGIIEG